jgi:predicted phosphodiesterase
MTRRLTVVWPDQRPFESRNGAPIRLLAVSDAIDPALDHRTNREAIGPLDVILGCGDLEPGYLGFLGDAFGVRVLYVRGNHDRGGEWSAAARGRRIICRVASSSRSTA